MLWALLGTLALTLTFVGIVTVVLVDRSLRNRLAGEAVAITEFNLAVLAPAAGVSAGATPEEVAESGILDRFLDRGPTGVWVEFAGGERVSAGDTRVDVAAGLEQIARSGEIGYQFTEDPGGLALVTAARMPPDGPLYYFVTPATLVVETTRQVALVAAGAGLVALVAGGLLAGGSSRRMLAPVAAARRAAEAMQAGDLDVRLDQEGGDEFGRLSAAFNAMAASLRATIAQLEEARARERRFVADVSHELRTPLTGLTNEAHLLHQRLRPGATVSADDITLAGLLEHDVSRLRHLVDDLLEISRLDSDALAFQARSVDLRAFIESLVAARAPGATVSTELEAPVVVDPRSLERIVGNLLDNAVRHAGGSPAEVTAALEGGSLVIEVSDRGPGVPPDQLARLTERFATVNASRGAGTGLGLAIADQHARRLGGTLEPRLRSGGGLTVRLQVPVGELLHGGETDVTSDLHSEGESSKGPIP